MKKRIWLIIIVALLAGGESAARYYGLNTPVLYESTNYGYRVAPNQNLTRFGNHVYYNRQGLRSEPMAPQPAKDSLRVLCVGDSITNGGAVIDQSLTYPYLLEAALQRHFSRAEVLNASAPGWALENEAGWLAANGIYQSRIVVLEIGTHDLFQPMAVGGIVGTHPSFPSAPPVSGLQELVLRYLLPRIGFGPKAQDPGVELSHRGKEDVARSMRVLTQIEQQVRSQGGRLLALLVEQPAELEPSDELTRFAKAQAVETLQRLDVPYVVTGEAIRSNGGTALFRDGLHPNARGNRLLAELIANKLRALTDMNFPALPNASHGPAATSFMTRRSHGGREGSGESAHRSS